MTYRSIKNPQPSRQGIELKKKYGQHFLKDRHFVDRMIEAVHLDRKISVMEVGCGEGILTGAILEKPCKQLKVFEIDKAWADFVQEKYGSDPRLNIIHENVLDVRFDMLKDDAPWVLLANLPYQITFPFLHRIHKGRAMFIEGVVMIQEEVAQKLVKKTGRDFGMQSLFFQHYFDMTLLDKIAPDAFFPPPKVYSRLLYFKPKQNINSIAQEEEFWKFIKLCFQQPRRTLRNNLTQTQLDLSCLQEEILLKRAQQLTMQDFLNIWTKLGH
jgi:16S rRNA (adenine1518-N6/adenine1519-N6)-dimethyltransferase